VNLEARSLFWENFNVLWLALTEKCLDLVDHPNIFVDGNYVFDVFRKAAEQDLLWLLLHLQILAPHNVTTT